uniref:Transcription factor bHLH80 isoform X1 n=1 Tax=Rhizophora mucronata TaxID=61149 RepID=A0A2P2KGS0_RHIMU
MQTNTADNFRFSFYFMSHILYLQQTNTADMLEEAVVYVKFLQRQIQELKEHQRQCKCMAKEH